MELIRLSDRVHYMPGCHDTDRPYLYHLQGDHYSMVVDAGNSKWHVEAFYHLLANHGLSLPKYTLITHWHWDHTFGLPFIVGKSISSALTMQKLKEVREWVWTEEAMQAREKSGEDIAFCNTCIRREYPDLHEIHVGLPDLAISEPTTLDAGGLHAHLIPTDSIHSRDAMLIHVPEEKLLITGDADCEDFYEGSIIEPHRADAYLKLVSGLDFDTYLIGHDEPDSRHEALSRLRALTSP